MVLVSSAPRLIMNLTPSVAQHVTTALRIKKRSDVLNQAMSSLSCTPQSQEFPE